MSETYFDIKITSGIEPKGEDSDFPILKSHHVETAEGHRLDDKLTAIDNQFAVDNQKIDAESARLDGRITTTTEELNNKIDANRDEVDGEINAINEHLAQTDANLAQEVTDRVNFGHAVNDVFAGINRQIADINQTVGDVDAALGATKVECKNYTDNEVTKEELARQQAIADEASNRAVADSSLQAQIDNKLNIVVYNQDKNVTDESIRTINNKLTAIPSTYATKAELNSTRSELLGKFEDKVDDATFEAYKDRVDGNISDINSTIGSLQDSVNNVKQDYLKSQDKADLEVEISKKVDTTTYDAGLSELNEIVAQKASKEELEEAKTTLQEEIDSIVETVEGDINSKLAVVEESIETLGASKVNTTVYEADKATFALKTDIPSIDHLASKEELAQVESGVEQTLSTKVDVVTFNAKNQEVDNKITQAQTNAVNIATSNLAPSIEANTAALDEKADKSSLSEYAKKADINTKQDVIVFAGDIETTTAIGGIPAGTNLRGMSLKEILTQMFGVSIPVTGLSLDKNTLTLSLNSSSSLTAQVQPADATSSTVSWVIEGDGATISSNEGPTITVTAGSTAGSAIITASCEGFTAMCTVTVGGEISAIQEILNNNIPVITGTSTDDATEVNWQVIDNATDTTDKTLQGFYTYKSGDDITAAGYQLTVPSATTIEGQVVYVPAIAKVKNVYTWDDLAGSTGAWNSVLDWSQLWVKQSNTTTVDNVEYTIYKYNPELDGTYLTDPSYWRFEIEL